MQKQLLFLCLFILVSLRLLSQDSTALPVKLPIGIIDPAYVDSVHEPLLLADSLNMLRRFHLNSGVSELTRLDSRKMLKLVYAANEMIGFSVPEPVMSSKRRMEDKDVLFYVLAGITLFFALLRAAFPKYFSDLFRLFFRTTIKQRQISEQLLASPVPSLLLNLYFLITAGLYSNFLLFHFDVSPVPHFWQMYTYCSLILLGIYLGKFILLKLTGWVFGISRVADSYIFVVFMINKVLGIFLLPFIIGLAFTRGTIYDLVLMLSFFGIGGFLLYRFIFSYRVLHGQIRLNPLYFFLYLCAFEVAPLLLIYKLIIPVF